MLDEKCRAAIVLMALRPEEYLLSHGSKDRIKRASEILGIDISDCSTRCDLAVKLASVLKLSELASVVKLSGGIHTEDKEFILCEGCESRINASNESVLKSKNGLPPGWTYDPEDNFYLCSDCSLKTDS
jgi:hypothetical protein